MSSSTTTSRSERQDAALSLYHLLDPEVLANPYPLFHQLRREDPVHWDPFLHAWIVTRYNDVMEVLHSFSADRTPTPEQLSAMGLTQLNPIAQVMVKQMLFMDAAAHTRLRGLASKAFTPARVEQLRGHIGEIVDRLLDTVEAKGRMDVIADFAEPLPAIVTAELLGVPVNDWPRLKAWSANFAEMLGNFQHNPEHAPVMLRTVEEMTSYFRDAVREITAHPCEGLIHSLITAEIDGDRLTEEEVIANSIVTMVGGQETTTNLIGNGLLTLLRHPGEMERLNGDLGLIPSAVEEMLRYESPSQHTARLAPGDRELAGRQIQKRQAVIAVMAAANRDPERFPDPDRFDITRADNRHLAFGYAVHFCFGAPLARAEGQLSFDRMLRRFRNLRLEPQTLAWRTNLGLRGLRALHVSFDSTKANGGSASGHRPNAVRVSEVDTPHTPPNPATPKGAAHPPDREAQLEKYLSERLQQKSITRRTGSGPAPLSFAQQQIWLHSQIAPDVPVYNEPVTIYRDGPLEPAILQSCLAEILRRHEAWRTTFALVNGEPAQIINPVPATDLPLVDLRHLPEPQRNAEALRLATEDARRPFDLKQCPLLRVLVVRLGDEQYRIYITLHHLIFDGISIYRGFLPELAALYGAFSRGESSPLADPPIQYADFAQWQRDHLRNGALDEHLQYWREKLSGDLPVLELPADYSRPPVQTFRGAIQSLHLPKGLSDQLKSFSRKENSTLFLTLLAVFKTLLHRYSGQDDVILGTIAASRGRAEFENLLGCFQNPVVLRTDFSGDPTFRQVLARVREATLGALQHDDVPFELVVKELHPQRDLSRNPLVQIAFSLVPQIAAKPAGWSAGQWDVETGAAKFDLYLEMEDEADGLTARFMYRTDLFKPETIERLKTNFTTLLEGIVSHVSGSVATLPLLTAGERQQLLTEWNDTRIEFPAELCLHDLVQKATQQSPAAVAAVFGEESITYRDLDIRSNQVARYLRRAGVKPEAGVGLYFERSIEAIVGILGVLKAGGACLPLDPAFPPERLAFILSETNAPVVLTHSRLRSQLPAQTARIICLDTDNELRAEEGAAPTTRSSDPESVAYIIYTSGSTGQPKGVRVTHRGLVNATLARTQFYREPLNAFLLLSSFSFDSSLAGIFWTLAAGAKLVLPPDSSRWELGALLDLIEKHRVSHLLCVPSLYQTLLETGTKEQLAPLRVAIVAGEACPPDLAGQHFRCVPYAAMYNEYGPTEASVWCSVYKCSPQSSSNTVPIGRPIANTQLYVLDSHMQLAPIGVAGELHIGGSGVTPGYLARPDLNAERFVASPFARDPEERLYKSGDRARYLTDGNLEWLGRMDGQVKLRGFRIELGEIEAALSQHPAVRRCAVLSREEQAGSPQLVGYVSLRAANQTSPDELRSHLAGRLPAHAIPSAFVFLDAIPQLPNGKVDTRRLPSLNAASDTRPVAVAPRSPVEEVVAGLWAQVLKRDMVGVRDDFFRLGGHSLLAAKLIVRIQRTLGVEVPLRAIFQRPTVEGLSALIESLRAEGMPSPTAPIPRLSRDTNPPLSFAQERLWFLDQLEPGNALYNVPCAVRISGTLNVDALARSVNEIVRRHEILRTHVSVVDGQPLQVIVPSLKVAMPLTDLAHLPPAEREAKAEELASEDARRSFNLATGPLLRTSLLRLDPDQHVLLLNIHHIATDETSRDVIMRELAALYEAFSQGKPSPLKELKIQYADYACWQREWLRNTSLERELNYWRPQLQGAPSLLELPSDRPRPALQSFRGASHHFKLGKNVAHALRALTQREGSTPFIALLTVFQLLLSRYTGEEDIVVGAPFTNRQRAEVEGLIGFFVNTLPLRARVSGALSFRELLRQVKETVLAAYDHRELPFEKLVEALRPERNLSYNPLVQVFFALQNASLPVAETSGLTLELRDVNSGTAKFDLSLYLKEEPSGELGGSLEYSTDLFDAARIARMAGHFQTLLEGAVACPDQPVSSMPLLTAKERNQILVEWNSTSADVPRQQCIQDLFERQVERTPESVAVNFERQTIAYRELNRRANQLAHHLLKQGVGPDVRVGVCMERSLEMVVALLGILKAGGAYLPLDPDYPRDRLAFMLADADPLLILTQSKLAGILPEHKAGVLNLEADAALFERESGENPQRLPGADHAAYVIYTSGSTGQPKGVVNVHRGIVNRLLWMQHAYQLDGSDRVLQKTPYSFDVSVWELFWPLITGASLVVARPEGHKDPNYLIDLIAEHKITTVHFVPSMLRAFLEAQGVEQCRSWRRVICSGEALTVDLQERFFQRLSCELHNLYGPTEASVDVTSWQCAANSALVAIGRPIWNTQIYILDKHLQPVPAGVAGELHIGGIGLAREYLNRPELTAEKFIAHPFSTDPAARLYKTGDLARFHDDGNIEYIGRIDDQVKIRGFRVELGEVEAALAKHPAVREAVVIARTEGSQPRLIAYLVANGRSAPEAGELRKFLRTQLPEFMIPSELVALKAFPLSSSGKVDRRALPDPQPAPAREETTGAPTDPVEAQLLLMWHELLPGKTIGIRDNFFDLGGHSLLAVRFMQRIEQSFDRRLPLTTLFEAPTIEQFAARLREQGWKPSQSSIVPIQSEGSLPPFFCIHGLGGAVLRFRSLAQHLGSDQPFYGVQAQGLDGDRPFHTSVEEMAAFYIREIRAFQPDGPYYIGGYSLGGLIAFEMARQLQAVGQKVGMLALFDAYPGKSKSSAMRTFLALSNRQRWGYLAHRAKRIRKGIRRKYDALFLPRPLRQVRQVFAAVHEAYKPQVYRGSAVWFRTTEKGVRGADTPQDDWSKWATGGVELHEIEGDHGSMLREPQVRLLAEQLRASLAKAYSQEQGSFIDQTGPRALRAEERQRILVEWNATAAEYPSDKCVHQLVEAAAAATPDAIAASHDREKVTYRELNQRANQLAHYLRRHGVRPDVPVGICLPPSVDLTVALLGVLKAGGACLPLDPAYPQDRLQWMLQDSQAPMLVSREGVLPELRSEGSQRICLKDCAPLLARESRENPEANGLPSHLAYLIYTSGSTGRPKGVMLPHRGLVNYITAAVKLYGLRSTDRTLQFSSISFDIAIEEMFPTWAAGGTLVLRSKDFSLAGSDFLRFARQQKLTVISVATAYWHELVHELAQSGAALPETLRLLIVGGEKAQTQALESWRKVAGDRVRWINTYGPTETCVIATAYEPPISGPLPAPLPIGRPVQNVRVYILDQEMQPLAVGEPGEVHIGGPGVACGYLNSPELTAAKFVRDSFSDDPQARLYKTGDLARYLPNGEIEFVGRRDFQIKIRGFRVELGEIESALATHPRVRQAVVVARNEGLNNHRLAGYVIPAAGSSVSVADLRIYLQQRLPDYMVPSDFVVVEKFPLTPNGKVDRKALPAPLPGSESGTDHVPANPVEAQLVALWEEILSRKPVGTRDNFFELGGHSLLAVRLMGRVEKQFKRSLPMTTLFEAPTIEQFAALLQHERWQPSHASLVPIQPEGDRAPFFCVHGLGGTVLRFNGLARHMGTDRPFYGVQAQGLEGDRPFHTRVEEMAAFYLKEIRAFQPEGPYYLGGYSLGGLIAFEMARQLQADGHEVGLLALLDTYPGKPRSSGMLLRTLASLPRAQQAAYIAHRAKRIRKGMRRRLDTLFLPRPLKEVRKVFALVEESYKPQVYAGRAAWFRAAEKGLRGVDDPSDNWEKWITGGVEIHEIGGDHGSILKEPEVRQLAEKLRERLNQAEEQSAGRELETQLS